MQRKEIITRSWICENAATVNVTWDPTVTADLLHPFYMMFFFGNAIPCMDVLPNFITSDCFGSIFK